MILSGRYICAAITDSEILSSIPASTFVFVECTIASGANGVISRHGSGDDPSPRSTYLQHRSNADGNLVPKKPDFFDQECSQPASMSTPSIYFRGSCACSRVSYTSAAPPNNTTTCFCTTCRKLSGSPSMTFTHIAPKALTFRDNKSGAKYEGWPSSGEDSGFRSLRLSTFAERTACVECNSPMAMRLGAWKEIVGIVVASVDEPLDGGEGVVEGFKATQAIFVGSAPAWIDVSEKNLGIKTCERFDVGVEEVVVKGRVQ